MTQISGFRLSSFIARGGKLPQSIGRRDSTDWSVKSRRVCGSAIWAKSAQLIRGRRGFGGGRGRLPRGDLSSGGAVHRARRSRRGRRPGREHRASPGAGGAGRHDPRRPAHRSARRRWRSSASPWKRSWPFHRPRHGAHSNRSAMRASLPVLFHQRRPVHVSRPVLSDKGRPVDASRPVLFPKKALWPVEAPYFTAENAGRTHRNSFFSRRTR